MNQDRTFQDALRQLHNVDALYDQATTLFVSGDARQAFIVFDISVLACPLNAQYRLSRGICAFKLGVYLLALEDANEARRIREAERSDPQTKRLRDTLSAKLQETIDFDNSRHLARCLYWSGKAELMLRNVKTAKKYFAASFELFRNEKAKEMEATCAKIEIENQGKGDFRRFLASNVPMKLFYNEEQQIVRLPPFYGTSATWYSSLEHPYVERLGETFIGSLGIFDVNQYKEQRTKYILRALRQQDALQSAHRAPLSDS